MQQYLRLKKQYADSILLFQMGDFFECFFEDAKILARELGITLTSREKGEDAPPMAGFPIKALDSYLPKLVAKGYKVAVAEQIEDPKLAKGIVKRKVTEIVTQGTFTNTSKLESKKQNYLLSITQDKQTVAVAFIDLLQGDISFTYFAKDQKDIKELIAILPIAEVITNDLQLKGLIPNNTPIQLITAPNDPKSYIKDTLHIHDLEAIDIQKPSEIYAIANLLEYILYTKQMAPQHFFTVKRWNPFKYMQLDSTTITNLELFTNIRAKDNKHTLLAILDRTLTPQGGRLLYNFMLHPLLDKQLVQRRQKHTLFFYKNNSKLTAIREQLKHIFDIERLAGLIAFKRVNPKQLLALKQSIIAALKVIRDTTAIKHNLKLSKIEKVAQIIDNAINPEAPTILTDGNILKASFHPRIKELRTLTNNTELILKKILADEKQKTGIPNLKLGYNKVFGYYFEIPKGQLNKVPDYFIRKQTLVNAERFITPQIKELEEKILNAQTELITLEQQLYNELIQNLGGYVPDLKALSDYIAYIDVISNFAFIAQKYNYVMPEILDETSDIELKLEESRHPVVERFTQNFVPNSITINKQQNFVILTGPNMGGKSTFIRQLAQIGSFVPAKTAKLSLRDRIFARVGASDDISTGRSTFMVEMSEVARIIHNATPHSLIILDEVGRGTNTAEGLSLAFAISQYIANQIKALTIFATHYHELTQLENNNQFINYKVDVLEKDNTVYFLHSISRGGTDKSYGIYIAKLVNLPEEIIQIAESKLTELLQNKLQLTPQPANSKKTESNATLTQSFQLPLFTDPQIKQYRKIINKLKNVNPDEISPFEALKLLYSIKKQLNSN